MKMVLKGFCALAALLLAGCAGGAKLTDQGCLEKYGYCAFVAQSADSGSGPINVTQVIVPMNGQNDGKPIVNASAGNSILQDIMAGTGPAIALSAGYVAGNAIAAAQADPSTSETNVSQTGGGASVSDVSATGGAGGNAIAGATANSVSQSAAQARASGGSRGGQHRPRGGRHGGGQNIDQTNFGGGCQINAMC